MLPVFFMISDAMFHHAKAPNAIIPFTIPVGFTSIKYGSVARTLTLYKRYLTISAKYPFMIRRIFLKFQFFAKFV